MRVGSAFAVQAKFCASLAAHVEAFALFSFSEFGCAHIGLLGFSYKKVALAMAVNTIEVVLPVHA
jgi:hypothetical protein